MFEATIPSRPDGGNWRLTSNEQHRHDSSRLRAGHTVAGARKLRSLSTSAQQGSCYLFGLRGGLQPQSTCLPALRSALQPLHSRVIDGFACTHICAEAVSDLHQASTSLLAHTRPTSCAPACETSYTCGSFQNRPQLTGLLAELLLSHLPTDSGDSLTHPGAAAHTNLVPIPTQWRRQMRRGFDHTWLLANAIQSR